jgi:hypothetical protein
MMRNLGRERKINFYIGEKKRFDHAKAKKGKKN